MNIDTSFTTLNGLSVQLRKYAAYCGGGHVTLKEAEAALNQMADDLDEVNFRIINASKKETERIHTYTGIDERGYDLINRHKHIIYNEDEEV